jgi:hypothetical protein
VDMIVSGGAVIHVKSQHGVDPYFDIPMPRSMKGWQKKWYYLKIDTSALLLVFIGSRHIPLPSWGRGMVWLGRTSASCSPCTRPFNSCYRRG